MELRFYASKHASISVSLQRAEFFSVWILDDGELKKWSWHDTLGSWCAVPRKMAP